MSFAARHWYRFSAVSALLYPVSLLFRLLVRASQITKGVLANGAEGRV